MQPVRERKLRVSFGFRSSSDTTSHCFGVNSLVLDEGRNRLYSAGRDATVRCWQVDEDKDIVHLKSFDHHTDWVNDIILCKDKTKLISCSSDTTVKIWNTENATCLETLTQHVDYVKALTYSPLTNVFASAGLDRMIYVWDLETCQSSSQISDSTPPTNQSSDTSKVSKSNTQNKSELPTGLIAKATGHKDSLYSLAMNSRGSLIVSGSTDKVLRVWDPRSGAKQFKLKGHRDNVRTILINEEGSLCISGSSDFTIKIWDLGQQRCVKTIDLHDDSVWALAANSSFSQIFSGGRDCNIYCTDLSSYASLLLARDETPILKLYASSDYSLWHTTTKPTIKYWTFDVKQQLLKDLATKDRRKSGRQFSHKFGDEDDESPLVNQPVKVIGGRPGIIKHQILNNRRFILSKDEAGGVKLWDVTRAELVADCGVVSLEQKVEDLFEMVSIPNWFTVDTKTGSITIHLDYPQCFNAEVYAVEAGLTGVLQEDAKVNLGEKMLSALFGTWVAEYKKKQKQNTSFSSNSTTHSGLSNLAGASLLNSYFAQPLTPKNGEFPSRRPSDSALTKLTGNVKNGTELNQSETRVPSSQSHSPRSTQTTTFISYDSAISRFTISRQTESPIHTVDSHIDQTQTKPQPTSFPNISHTNSIVSIDGGKQETQEHTQQTDEKAQEQNQEQKQTQEHETRQTRGQAPTSLFESNLKQNNYSQQQQSEAQKSTEALYYPVGKDTPVIISEKGTGATIYRACIGDFTGSEKLDVTIPRWVYECVIKGDVHNRESKIHFRLVCIDEKDLPKCLPQSKLSATRLTKIKRIMGFVLGKLEIDLPPKDGVIVENSETLPQNENPSDNGSESSDNSNKVTIAPEEYLEILCNEKVLKPDMTVGTVKTFFWKSSDDLVLMYRRKEKYQGTPMLFKNRVPRKK